MTYKEQLEVLYNVFAIASEKYIENQKELYAVNGFFDGKLIEDAGRLKKEWEKAAKEYHNFEAFVRNENIDIESDSVDK